MPDQPKEPPTYKPAPNSVPSGGVKQAIDLKPDALKQVGKHKVVTLNNGQREIKFIRGKDSVLLSGDKLTILFSDLNKPVKIPVAGKEQYKTGPPAAELIKDFGLTVREYKPPAGTVNTVSVYTPARRHVATPIPERIDNAARDLQDLIKILPGTVSVTAIQSAILALNRIKPLMQSRGSRNGAVSHTLSGGFRGEMQSAAYQRRR